jgi:hypothetical protein
MLIRRDALIPDGYGFDGLVTARSAPPRIGYVLNPQQEWEAKQKHKLDQAKAELIEKVTKNATEEGARQFAKTWLRV